MLDLKKYKKIHFIGIGGIGVSGLAKILLAQGKRISGSDLVFSKNLLDLKKLGAKISIGPHKAKNVSKDLDLVIYTQAATDDNPEIIAAKKFAIKTLSYPEVLGQMTKDKFSICISGTHGKTTTTSLASLVLTKAGLDPTCIIGSNLKEFDGNARYGGGKYFVLEADEYKGAFLNYWPKVIILTTIEYEHPDYFKNLRHTIDIFKEYVSHLAKESVLIANTDDKNIIEVAKSVKCKVITYGIKNKKADFVAENVKLEGGYPEFKFSISNFQFSIKSQFPNHKFQNFQLKIPGIHNVYNALAVIALAAELKIDLKFAQNVLSNYRGAWRRFEYKKVILKKNITIIDDYAHHPTEVKVTLAAARQRFPKEKIICIFQPHQIKRTKVLFNDFTKAFFDADQVILTDIYAVAGRDSGSIKKDSKKIAQALVKKGVTTKYLKSFDEILNYIIKTAKKNCVIMTMGAGDITKLSDELAKRLS